MSLVGILWTASALIGATPESTSSGVNPVCFGETHREPVNGTTLHFRVRGCDRANPYLLILHGGPGSSALEFYPWGQQLERELNVVYLDQRGSGLSERVKFKNPDAPTPAEARGFTFADMVEDIEAVRRAIGTNKWFVLGHSFGGMVGLEYVTAKSEHVLGYVHMDGLISMPMINQDWLDYAERAVRETARAGDPADKERVAEVLANVALVRAMSPEERNQNIGPLVISRIMPERIRDRFPAANEYDGRIDSEVLKRYGVSPDALGAPEPGKAIDLNEGLATREAISLFEDLRMPVLIISAAQDPIIPPTRMALMHRMVPQSQFVTIDNAGHEVFKDQPQQTASAVIRFTDASVRSERARQNSFPARRHH